MNREYDSLKEELWNVYRESNRQGYGHWLTQNDVLEGEKIEPIEEDDKHEKNQEILETDIQEREPPIV